MHRNWCKSIARLLVKIKVYFFLSRIWYQDCHSCFQILFCFLKIFLDWYTFTYFYYKIKFVNILLLVNFHFFFLYKAFIYGNIAGIGITAGAHRLWAHRSYRAKLPLRMLLAVMYCMAGLVRFLSMLKSEDKDLPYSYINQS